MIDMESDYIPSLFDDSVSTEGLIDMIRKWLADRRERKRLERLEKNRYEYQKYRTTMYNDYRLYVIGLMNIDTIRVPRLSDFIKYFTTFSAVMNKLITADVSKFKSKMDVDALLLQSQPSKIFVKDKSGAIKVQNPAVVEQLFSNSEWSKRGSINRLESAQTQIDDLCFRYYENYTAFIDKLNKYLDTKSGEELQKTYGIVSYYLNLVDFISTISGKIGTGVFRAMIVISRS